MASARTRYLFLLSHMRSYSTVLAHILGSSPEVDGYGETHLRYRSRWSLWALPWKVRRATGAPLRGPWLLDKLLHNRIRGPWRLLPAERYRVLIFLRQPRPTLQSLLAMQPILPTDQPWTAHRACEYYVERLHRLRIEGERIGRQAIYLDAEALLQHPAAVLARLGAWLSLQTPLSADYKVFPRTGRTGIGDPGEHIHSGRLKSDTERGSCSRWIDPLVLAEAEAAYQRCRAALLQTCSSDSCLLLDSATAS
ncbi:MAG TPA: hypothetical protein VMI92_05070 [Steroidobacteraceae bacterium]|nr:hypothetical protein [Steroidobacteraceae bacterium]